MTESRSSQAAACLERVWEMLRGIRPEIPAAVLLVYAHQTRKPRQNGGVLLGHFTRHVWRAPGPKKRHEVGVSPYLFDEPKEMLNTLLHEAAHAALFERDPLCRHHRGGCSITDPFYHRTEFRDLCRQWGLACEFLNNRYGHCLTTWPGGRVAEEYMGALDVLKNELPLGVKADPSHHGKPQLFRMRCGCSDQSRSVYVRLPVALAGQIICRSCGREFRPAVPLPETGATAKIL
jgi:hypothetical protein